MALARRGPFVAMTMLDDGTHGDGAALDGVFGAVRDDLPQGEAVHWYVEALGAGDEPHAAFAPDAASCGAFRTELPGKKAKKGSK